MPDKSYKRLTWRRRRSSKVALSVPRASLLLGEDHILKIESTLFSETYKRFFFRDIQSITIKTNRRRSLWNVVLVVVAVLLVLEALLDTTPSTAWGVTMGIFATTTFVLLFLNNVFGTTCDVSIQTAVQKDDLTPLSRVRRANEALERLRPLIAQAQGQYTPEETVLRLHDMFAPAGAKAASASQTGPLNL